MCARKESQRNVPVFSTASSTWTMDGFIKVVKQLENGSRGSEPIAVLKKLRRAAGLNDAFIQHFLGNATSSGSEMDTGLSGRIGKFLQHKVTEDARERGVVLTSDGTTVSLKPLLLGIEAGFLSKAGERVQGLLQLTLARDLSSAFRHSSERLGSDGCWDSVTSPTVFTLSDKHSTLTTAQVNGGMDGVILGFAVSSKSRRPLKLSNLLRAYYVEKDGVETTRRLISRRRRESFRRLARPKVLITQVMKSLELQARLNGHPKMAAKQKKRLLSVVKEGMKEFVHKYLGEHETKSTDDFISMMSFKLICKHLTSSSKTLFICFRLPTHHSEVYVGCTAVQRNTDQPVPSSLLHLHPPHFRTKRALSNLPAVLCKHALHPAVPPGGEGLGRHRIQVEAVTASFSKQISTSLHLF